MATWATNKLTPSSPMAPGGLPAKGAAQGLDLPALDRAAGSRKEGLAGGPSSRQVAGGLVGVTSLSSGHPVHPHSCCREHLPGICSLRRVSAMPATLWLRLAVIPRCRREIGAAGLT